MKVAHIMSKKVITIRAFATVAHAVKLMREHGLSSLIVERLDESDSYGIVSQTDIIYQSCGFVKGITLNWLNHLELDSNRSSDSLKRLLRQSVIRGHSRNHASLSLFVVIGAAPHSSRRGRSTAHRKINAVTAGQSVDTSLSKFKL